MHLAGGLFALALAATVTSRTGLYVADARFEHYWDPIGFLSQHRALWDEVRTLGRPTLYYSPAAGSLLAGLSWVGLPPWLLQRVLHAVYLTVAGVGMAQVLRLHRPRMGAAHAVAALLYVFNPYTTQFLVPSGLFLHYAAAPWLVVALGRGVREPRRWFWPALFALTVFSLGSLNGASVAYAALPLLPLAIHLLAIERSVGLRDLFRWTWRAGALTLGCCLTALMVVQSSAPVIARNLSSTESPLAVSRRSSWAESLRGLGSWLSYLRTPDGLVKPQALPFFEQPLVIAATFAVPILAILALASRRVRARGLFGMWIVVGLVAMVHLYPVTDPPPLGAALRSLYENEIGARGFRDGYKAGTSLLLGLSALAALALTEVLPVLMRRRSLRRMAVGLLAVPVAVAAFPFWTGTLYQPTDVADDVPGYWTEALDWLEDSAESGHVMIVPGSNRTQYRWGYVGDDIFDALLDRRHVTRWSLPQATPETADLIETIDAAASDPSYEPGTLAPLAQRLGIRWLVIRNDTDWQAMEGPRPAAFDALRADPDLELAASFGDPGQNTVAATVLDDPNPIPSEAELPPVEVYEIPSVIGGARRDPTRAPILVSGDGEGLEGLARTGELQAMGPFVYTGSADVRDVRAAVAAGTRAFITDTNRRTLTYVRSTATVETRTLFADETAERPPTRLFDAPGSDSVRISPTGVSVSSPTDTARAVEVSGRSGDAFDGVSRTAWWVETVGDSIVVGFDRPTRIERVEIDTFSQRDGRTITGLGVAVDQSAPAPIPVPESGRVALDLGGTYSTLVIEVGAISPGVGRIGLAEVRVDDLDLADLVRVPDDLFRMADTDDALAEALADTPLSYRFERVVGPERVRPEEAVVRRLFRVDRERTFTVTVGGDDRRLARTATERADGCIELLTIDEQVVGFSPDPGGEGWRSCDDVELSAGWHRLSTSPALGFALARIGLDDVRFPDVDPAPSPAPVPTVADDRPSSRVAALEEPGWLVLDEAYAPGWAAEIDGAVAEPTRLDTLNAWWVEDPADVEVWYRPQQLYDTTLMVSGASVALCLWLVGRDVLGRGMWGRRHLRTPRGDPSPSGGNDDG